MAGLGESFMLPKPGGGTPHLWIVLSNPDPQDMVIMVNLTTRRANSDTTTVLKNGDHPFIHHDSVVFYADARQIQANHIDQGVANGVVTTHAHFTPPILAKVQAGVLASRFTPGKIKTAFTNARNDGRT